MSRFQVKSCDMILKYCFPDIENIVEREMRIEEIKYFQNSDFDRLHYDENDADFMNYIKHVAIRKCFLTYTVYSIIPRNGVRLVNFTGEFEFFITSIDSFNIYIFRLLIANNVQQLKVGVLYME